MEENIEPESEVEKTPEVPQQEIIKKPNTLFTFELDGDTLKFHIFVPDDADPYKIAMFLYRLQKAEFAEIILQNFAKACNDSKNVEVCEIAIEEFTKLWKVNKVAVKPSQVFKDR